MATLTFDSANQVWPVQITPTSSGNSLVTLRTLNKFVRGDIAITTSVRLASNFTFATTANTTQVLTATKNGTTNYIISGTVSSTVSAGTSGWFSSQTGSAASANLGVVPIAAASLNLRSGSTTITNSNVAMGTTNNSGISISAYGAFAYDKDVTTAGYLSENGQITVTGSAYSTNETRYLDGVTLQGAGKKFYIIIPNGSSTASLKLTFTVNSDGLGVTVT